MEDIKCDIKTLSTVYTICDDIERLTPTELPRDVTNMAPLQLSKLQREEETVSLVEEEEELLALLIIPHLGDSPPDFLISPPDFLLQR